MAVKKTTSGNRRCVLTAHVFSRFVSALFFLPVVWGMGAAPAYSQSGETDDLVFRVPAQQCNLLRSETGLDDGNLIFACDANRQGCRLVTGGGTTNRALGFCDDRFDRLDPVREGVLEEDVRVRATTFGAITGVQFHPVDADIDGIDADIVCETFDGVGAGVKACATVVADPAADEEGGVEGESCGGFITTASDCANLQSILAGVTGDPDIELSFGLFIDVDLVNQPGSEALLVCPGFRAECGAPLGESAVIEYQFIKQVIDTPGTTKLGGTTIRYSP